MAAYFTNKEGQDIVRYIGDKNAFDPSDIAEIVEVQLDGHELEYVCQEMTGIPMHKNKRVQKFYGDHAKFIAGNW
ncbi:MAG: hypothetical protein EKK63_13765 [Acinetobacter sp.]|jgi:hypothetical protein|uniref:hypothetical protein n=1 Tax=Acinetobacter sp. TaxID=472 RepID=UPI000FB393BD|nr:hypothetical protein [Acinetobacter sp.]RUP37969.1 MAG: hypothetical protein EKK63_13765 [Acinetobacter sp.]